MKSRVLYCCFLIFSLAGCFADKVHIEPNSRFQVSGSINASAELDEMEIFSFAGEVFNDDLVNGNQFNLLGSGMIRQNGQFEFMSLDPINRQIYISINDNFSEFYDPLYETLIIRVDNVRDYAIKLPEIDLRPLQNVNLTVSASEEMEVQYEVRYSRAFRSYYYDHSVLEEIEGDSYEHRSTSGIFVSGSGQEIVEFGSISGSTVTVIFYTAEDVIERSFIIEPGTSDYEISL